MGWLIALAVLCGLWFLPLGVRAEYRDQQGGVRLYVGPFVVARFPGKPKKHKKSEHKESTKGKESKKGGSYKDFLPIVRAVVDFLKEFRQKLRIRRLEMQLVLAGDDPCNLAVNYGRAWAALGNLVPLLEQVFVIKKRDLNVDCDFTAETTLIYVRADATITLGRLLQLLFGKGAKVFKEYSKLKKLRKGGTEL